MAVLYYVETSLELLHRTLIYWIKVPVWLPHFEKKPWSMFCDYFRPVKNISIDWLDSWFYFVQSARNQGNQLKYFLLLKNNHKTLIKVFPQNSVIVPVRLFGSLEYLISLSESLLPFRQIWFLLRSKWRWLNKQFRGIAIIVHVTRPNCREQWVAGHLPLAFPKPSQKRSFPVVYCFVQWKGGRRLWRTKWWPPCQPYFETCRIRI